MKYNNIEEYLKNTTNPEFENRKHKEELKLKIVNKLKNSSVEKENINRKKSELYFKFQVSIAACMLIVFAGIFIFFNVFQKTVPENKITMLNGTINYRNNSNSLETLLTKDRSLNEGCILESGKNSSFELSLENDTLIKAADMTKFTIDQFRKKDKNAINVFSLNKGKIECVVHLPSKESKFEIHTSNAIIAVTGTVFSVEVADNDDMTLVVEKGTVIVRKVIDSSVNLEKIKIKNKDVYDSIIAIISEPIQVESDFNLVIKNYDIISLENEIKALVDNLIGKPEQIRNTMDIIIQIDKTIGNNLKRNISTDDHSVDITKAEDNPENKINNNVVENKSTGEIDWKDKTPDDANWTLTAENDFSVTLTPDNFGTFVLYQNNGNYDMKNGKCKYTGTEDLSCGIIFAKKTSNETKRYKLSVDPVSFSNSKAKLSLGLWIDKNRSFSGIIDKESIYLSDPTGKIIKSARHFLKNFNKTIFEVTISEDNISEKIIDKISGKEIKLTSDINGSDLSGEIAIKSEGIGEIVFDNVTISCKK